MTLKEMAAQYRANLIPWKERSAMLRKEIAACPDTQKRLALEQRLRMILQVCREGREAAHTMETYYETRSEMYGIQKKTSPLSDLSKQ